ncbi:MAG: hypothetical protein JSV95_04405 [Gemmatimonadota bacterium]|nr:MAG: hypothetical protein JSV95_04405 [Gemmatimonadota bacterium]
MSDSTSHRPMVYGGLLDLEHRLMSGAILALAVIVLVLFGGQGPRVRDGQSAEADAGQLPSPEWVRPAEIRVQPPVLDAGAGRGAGADLDSSRGR